MVLLDIQMPEDCFCCPLFNDTYLFCVVGSRGCIDRYGYDSNEKPSWCPIVDNDWISCKERPPKVEGSYLVTNDDNGTRTVREDVWLDRWIFSKHVLAWKPLPDPYEGD